MGPTTSSLSDFRGVWTAIATPFKSDFEVDWASFEKLLALQVAGGVKGVVISGTTGESPTLTVQEKLGLIRKARAILPAEIRVMAGTGDNNTQHSVELSRLAADAGADSLLVVTPPYNKPSLNGLLLHYDAIKNAVKIPICLYHVPSRTSHFLPSEQLAHLCQNGRIGAVKEASADLAYFSKTREKAKVPFLSGDDATLLPSLAVGGEGTISVVSNIFPKALVQMTEAFWQGNWQQALAIHQTLLPVIDALFCEVNPSPLKAAMKVLGIGENILRAPLAPVTDANFKKVEEAVQTTRDHLERVLK